MRKSYLWLFALSGIMLLALAIYWPGMQGGYLFDDEPNLSLMGAHGGVRNWETFRAYVFQGQAGPLGRPIALASFLLDANTWPADPYFFKRTNVFIHLGVGLSLLWATFNLLRFYGVTVSQAKWCAVLNMAFWLLHPFMVSTTLYIVQRMTQLSTLFVFMGLAGYLQGRLMLRNNPSISGYFWMSTALCFGTGLAAFSKENGLLLPMLVWVVETCKPNMINGLTQSEELDPRWKIVFLGLPTAAILVYLAQRINFSPDAWPTRQFDQFERLLTQPRIIWDYLFQIFIPRIEGKGLFQDGYPFSKGWFQPATTFLSLASLILLTLSAFWIKGRSRAGSYIALAFLFFLTAHILESSLIGLELYFEHRNYTAAAFIFLPISMAILSLSTRWGRKIAFALVLGVLSVISFLTWERVNLWSDVRVLQNYWALKSPESGRAQVYLSTQLFEANRPADAFRLLEAAMHRIPWSSQVSMQWLLHKLMRFEATAADFERVREGLPKQRFDTQGLMGIRTIVEVLLESPKHTESQRKALTLLDAMREIPHYRAVPIFNTVEPYLRGLLLMAQGEADEATFYLQKSIHLFNDVDNSISTVLNMANSGYLSQALYLLLETEKVLGNQKDSELRRTRENYNLEIEGIRSAIHARLNIISNKVSP